MKDAYEKGTFLNEATPEKMCAAAALHGESVFRMILEWRYSGYIRVTYDDGGYNSYGWY